MEILLITLISLVIYTFIGYPIIITFLSFLFSKKIVKKERTDYKVTLIIAAYNEEDVIKEKILNSLSLDYPRENIEIIVASDGSIDKTDEIVKEFESNGVVLNRVEGRKGKTEAQNKTVEISNGEIIVFSDANAIYHADAIKKLVRNFNDEAVGGVCGKLVYIDKKKSNSDSESIYWAYENILKEGEGRLSSVIGANGSIYAVRKNLYTPLNYSLISDFVEPLKVVEKGYRFVYEKDAISCEESESVEGAHAFNRKVRINIRTIIGIYESIRLLNIFKYGWVSLQYFSRKVIRYLMPFILIALFITNIFVTDSWRWEWFLYGQILFYVSALIYALFENTVQHNIKILSLAWYFVLVHLAIITAFFNILRGERKTTWETKRG